MKEQKRVFNKLFKEEKTDLATQKIELALIDDVKSITKELDDILSSMDKEGDELGRLLGDATRKQRVLESLNEKQQAAATKAIKIIQDVEKASKELGVSNPKELNNLKKKYRDAAEYDFIVKGIGKIPLV